jgi:hypothetical protein
MRNKLIVLLLGFFLVFSCSSFAQNKKNKKAKKSKSNVELSVADTTKSKNVNLPTLNSTPVNQNNTPGKQNVPVVSSQSGTIATNIQQIVADSKPVITDKPNGDINWTEQYIEAKGMSVIDNVKFKNPAQAKLMAKRGATVDAQRNLLEIIKGVNVTSETTVNDMITSSDFIYTRVDGVVKGAQMVGEPIEKDGVIEVKMRVPLYDTKGVASAVYDQVPALKKVQKVNDIINQVPPELKDQVLDGLAFNLNGKKYDPSMFPVIVDENNNLVLDLSKLYDPNSGKFPQLLSSTEEVFKEVGFDKGVQMINVLKAETGKITIDNQSVKKINWTKIGQTVSKIGKFLLMLV